MLEIAQLPLARRLWRISSFFKIPINDPRIQEMTAFDLDFYEYSMILDDPEKKRKLTEQIRDPEFDQWVEDFDNGEDDDLDKYDDPSLYEDLVPIDDEWEEVEE